MERKSGPRAVTVEAEAVKRAVGTTRTLASEEEKALRMRHGVPVSPTAPLARAAGSNTELADELLLMEMQLLRAMRSRQVKRPTALAVQAAATTTTAARPSATKEKIVRALRKKR